MDLDFRASTIHSTTHFSSLQRLHSEYSAYSYTDEDDDAKPLIRCPSCDFEIDFSRVSSRLDIDPKNMLCPVCDEILGDAIRVAQRSSSQKRTLKSDKSSILSGDSVVLDKKVPARGSKHERVPEPLFSKCIHSVSAPTSSGVHPGEGSSSIASDISDAKGSGTDAPADSGDEKDIEEKRLRASFAQELVLSTLI